MSNHHPRALASGLIPCANCGHRLGDGASFCPQCRYHWPQARDRNRVICPACNHSVALYVRRVNCSVNRWDRAAACEYCGKPEPWRGQAVDARNPPPPSLSERVTALAVLITVGTIISLMLG